MAIDPPRLPPRGTGPLLPGAIRPPVPQPGRVGMPAPIGVPPRVRAPGTTKLEPDLLQTQVRAIKAPDDPGELAAPKANQAIDSPEWVGVKRALGDLPPMSAGKRRRLEVAVRKYAREGGDPKVAWGVLMQIKQPFKRIGQAGSHTCARAAPADRGGPGARARELLHQAQGPGRAPPLPARQAGRRRRDLGRPARRAAPERRAAGGVPEPGAGPRGLRPGDRHHRVRDGRAAGAGAAEALRKVLAKA